MSIKIYRVTACLDEGYPEGKSKDGGRYIVKMKRRWPRIDCLSLIGDSGFAISERAKAFFEGLKIPGLQFVPIGVNDETFYRCYSTRIIDCLDKKKSLIKYFKHDRNSIMSIEVHVFDDKHINERDIFVIPERFNTKNNYIQDTLATEAVKNAIQAAGLIGFEFLALQDDRDPLAFGEGSYVFEEENFGLRLKIPDGWTISTEKVYGDTPNKLRQHKKPNVGSPDKRMLLEMSFFRLDTPARRSGGIDLWLLRNTTTTKTKIQISEELAKYKYGKDKVSEGTMTIAKTVFQYIDAGLDHDVLPGTIRLAKAPLDDEYYLSIMLRGYTPPLYEAILKIISKLEFRKTK